jgi:DNA-binding beta-propeller fold protein YncE
MFAAFAVLPIVGCTSSSVAPPGSKMLAEERGRVMAVAEDDGTVSVVDANNKAALYTGPVHKGDQVTVDPQANQIRVGSATMSHSLISDHKYQIFFKKT